jgi:hypothetical protein
MGAPFVIARNPQDGSKLAYLLRIPVDGGPLLLKSRETWPRTSKLYCHRFEEAWPTDAEVVEEFDVRHCAWRGKAIDLVLDRYRENRSQFVFATLKGGREAIFWQTAKTVKQVRPGLRVPTRRASGWRELEVVQDTRERYGYRFATQQARVVKRALPVGDYGVEVDGAVVAAVERKSLQDLAGRLADGNLAFAMAELSSLPNAAVVVEARYADLFAGSRKHAEEWTFRFLGAAAAEHAAEDPPGPGG